MNPFKNASIDKSSSRTPTEFWILREERYGIYLARDHYHGIAVQVAELVPVFGTNEHGQRVQSATQPHVIWQMIVPVVKAEPNKPFASVKPEDFHQELQKTIADARAQVAQLKNLEAIIAGSLTNYFTQAQAQNLNG